MKFEFEYPAQFVKLDGEIYVVGHLIYFIVVDVNTSSGLDK